MPEAMGATITRLLCDVLSCDGIGAGSELCSRPFKQPQLTTCFGGGWMPARVRPVGLGRFASSLRHAGGLVGCLWPCSGRRTATGLSAGSPKAS